MALQIHSPSSLTLYKPYHHLLQCKPNPRFKTLVTKSQNTSSTNTEESSTNPKPLNSKALGFGSSSTASGQANESKKSKPKSKRERERKSVVRREPFEKATLVSPEEEAKAKEEMKNESAFLLAWLGIGGLILVQGIALAASGFLPEKVDKLFVKYLYPTFTPTVGFFVAGTVAFGVVKYLQNEKLNEKK